MSETITLPARPVAGLIPRGLYGHTYASGRTQWFVSRGDLIQAHKLHVQSARYWTFKGKSADATFALTDAASVRRLLTVKGN
jgi:hypothetical protein